MPQHEVFIDLNHYRLMHGPIMVSFDITQRCNLRCVHCFNNSGDQAPNADMPRDTKLAIARQVAEMHPFNVCLCGGECLCSPELFEIMDILRPHVAKLSMVSNGWLISKKMAKQLAEHGLDLAQISIDGANAWQHDSFRGVMGSFERATAAVRNLKTTGHFHRGCVHGAQPAQLPQSGGIRRAVLVGNGKRYTLREYWDGGFKNL